MAADIEAFEQWLLRGGFQDTPAAAQIQTKGTPMPTRPSPPPHTNTAYAYCDALDAIEQQPGGRALAEALASDAIATAAAFFPRAVKTAVGEQELVIYKSAAATLPAMRFKASDPIDVAYQQLRTAHARGDAGQIQAALQQLMTLVTPAAGTVGTHLSDHEKGATKAAGLTPIQQLARKLTMPEQHIQKGSK